MDWLTRIGEPRPLAGAAVLLALTVVVLGAYVRLSEAGLGCPDWPGCYGQFTVPDDAQERQRAERDYPQFPLERDKARIEMTHRYAAGGLGLVILALSVSAWRARRRSPRIWLLSQCLLALLVAQSLLGMLTVTLLLKPPIVVAHLLGGMILLLLLWWLWLDLGERPASLPGSSRRASSWAVAALVVLLAQIALGGWTSSNYASLACPDFPTCQGQWWPEGLDFRGAFAPVANDVPGSLDAGAAMAVHLSHRLGALLFLAVAAVAGLRAWRVPALRCWAWALSILLVVQWLLGISNVLLALPIVVAVSHNAGAALLLLTIGALVYKTTNLHFPPVPCK